VRLFVDEARRYAVLDHENIGRIFDFENVDGKMCIILEYIDGWSLVGYLERHREAGRMPDVDLSVFIASRVCRALQYVFERSAIVHRDVSPSNIMMTREGTVKLIDFGIATRSGTRDSSLTGKPAYMAPEMVVELRADNRSDLFSLGAVLFEMLTLQRLFQGETTAEVLEKVITGHNPSPRSLNPAIPDGVIEIVRTALQREPSRRYASAGEMGAACEHYLYDKGYGPTNLSLRDYVTALFPEALPLDSGETDTFPAVDATLLPIADPFAVHISDLTPPARHEYTVAASHPPADSGGSTVPPGTAVPVPRPRPRRVKTRARQR
jgi:serine/threonine protein kinase